MATCLIGLGANQGNRAANLAAAIELLKAHPEISDVRNSRNYATHAAAGGALQNEFLNAAATFQTSLAPRLLLSVLQNIEDALGRNRLGRWAPREIDLDLLLYGNLVFSDPTLVLPHPRLAFRRFVLAPSAEIAANFVHPTTKFTVSELLMRLDRFPRRIVITGLSSERNKRLASDAAMKSDAVFVETPKIADLLDRQATMLASPTCATAIELAHQHRESNRIHFDASEACAETATEIRGSWVGECHALANLLLPVEELLEFERCLNDEQDADELDRATLIVVLLAAGDSDSAASLQAEIERLATTPRQSPWLLVDGQDPDWALTEVAAAIEAMQ